LKTNHCSSFHIIPPTNIIIAVALIMCIILRLILLGLFGSFFLKKYIKANLQYFWAKFNAKKEGFPVRKAFLIL
jgi:hypothetical protein